MSRRKSGRNVHGILLLDKPLGISSNRALQQVKHLFNAKKAGHTGSLDPLASGLLPLCFGEATKVSALMLDDNKRYQVVVKLGVMTDTGDAEGEVIAQKPVPPLTLDEVKQCLQDFVGEISQVPPMYSALKHNGKKLYELAREGKTVERKARNITIFELHLLDFKDEQLTLDVFCSKGTYIRSLAEDIGHKIGCGATVTELRRTRAGCFDISQAWTMEALQAMDLAQLTACLVDVDRPLKEIPAIELSSIEAGLIKHGQQIKEVNAKPHAVEGMVRMYSEQGFLGLGEMLINGSLVPKKIFNLNNELA